MEGMITLNNVSIGYRQLTGNAKIVKEDITLHASKGELVAIIGENGIGKSTLLRTIAGLQPLFEGKLDIMDRAICSYREKELALMLSFVSTEIIRVSNLNVFDLVSLGRYPHTGWTGKLNSEDQRTVEEAIAMTGLEGYENKPVNDISDGERQKTMIARSLAQDTAIIVLDEPTAFLDLSNKYEIIHLLHRLANEKGKTIIFSTHDLSTAIAESDKLWLMLAHTVKEGSPEDLVLDGTVASLFPTGHLFFDAERGEFRIRKETRRKVVVTCKKDLSGQYDSGMEVTWTAKMLDRIGFQVIAGEDGNSLDDLLTIEIASPNWIVRSKNSEISFNSLYSLGRYLKNLGSEE